MKRTHQNRIKIATYAIAKNESKHVARWLEATKESDYRIVLDTGSTDNTVELLKAGQNVIVGETIVSPWRFDTARNQALDLVPEDADVCLVLDMDEVPEKNFYRKVQKQWVRGADRGWISIDTGFRWRVDRLHSRKGWKWTWPCHEVAMWQGEGDYAFSDTTAVIYHKPDATKSRGQYLTMLQDAIKETPEDSRMWTYLCREYYFNNDWENVIRCAKKALEFDGWDVELAALCRWAGDAAKNLKQDSTYWFDEGAKICPDQGEPWMGVAADAFRHRNWEKCLDAAIRCFETPKQNHYLHEPTAWSWKAYDLAGAAAYNLGYLDEAISFGREALRGKGPESERIERNLKFMEGLKQNAQSRS